jgi:cyclopropane fatty-acyl-phospholipid synthase-like methyltransferase
MPELDSPFHINMLHRIKQKGQVERFGGIYGMNWGDPQKDDTEHNRRMRFMRDKFLLPYVHPDFTCVEIGPGGGRWTRYLMTCLTLYCLDYYQELLDELAANFRAPGLHLIRNNGTDFPGVPDQCCDFLFSYGVFVHLELPTIDAYLQNMRRILKPGAPVVLHYADKTKEAGRATKGFSENDPARMRELVLRNGYTITEEDMDTLPHSSVVRFSL